MPDVYRYPLTIAGVGITLQTPHPLPVPERFQPFLADGPLPGYLVEYQANPSLSRPEGEPLYRSESYEVCPDGAGGFVRWYFDGMDDFLPFLRVSQDKAARRVLAEYLPRKGELVSAMGNCFSFSGWEALLLREHRLILHAACVDTPLGGLLFSGPSGVGKSTQVGLWQQYAGARLINGDRPVLQKTAAGWRAWGSPYAGSSHCFRNESCLVRAVILLRQAPRCSLRRLSGGEAFRGVFAGTTANSWDRDSVLLACQLAEALIGDLPVYQLSCTPDRAAVELLKSHLERGAEP